MSGPLWLSGWLAALAALGVSAALWRELGRRAELVARACHELRGPLTAARLGLHGLCSGDDARASAEVAAIDGELRRVAVALEDLHAARAGRAGADRHEAIELGELLDEATAAWRPVAVAFGAELRVADAEGFGLVRGDRMRLAQACGNLLGNALEHGGRHIEVRGRVLGDRVRIEVADDGPGLPAPVAELTRRARAGRGRHGRGLAIAAEIAARHGGRLAAAPAPRGARLALELPALRAAGRSRPRGRRRTASDEVPTP